MNEIEGLRAAALKRKRVTVEVQNLTPKLLDVQIVPPPTALNATVLRQLFAELTNYNLDVFNSTPDGGAVFSNPAQQRQVTLTPAMRQVVLPVQIDASRSLGDVLNILNIAQTRMPAPLYVASSLSIASHLPVTGESAGDLIRRKALQNREAYNALGPGIKGVGLRVFMTSAGPFTFSVEPLLADQGKIVIQLQQVMPGNFELNELRGRCESTLRFYENQMKNFLDQLLTDR